MTPYKFFLKHAGYSYGLNETEEQGRKRCAKALAKAEANGRDAGLSFDWRICELDSSEWSDEKPDYEQWDCICRNKKGEIVASLGCIDFGRDETPWSSDYRRVVEAELAMEAMRA